MTARKWRQEELWHPDTGVAVDSRLERRSLLWVGQAPSRPWLKRIYALRNRIAHAKDRANATAEPRPPYSKDTGLLDVTGHGSGVTC
jgi:hypothetical protein